MPGFMGLRGLEKKNPYDMEKERREERRSSNTLIDAERRSQEKVQEILREQEGDMSAYSGGAPRAPRGECEAISRLPVEKIMTGRVAVLSFDDTLLTVNGILSSVKFRHLPVVDDQGNIIGIISDRDFLRMVSPFFATVNEQARDREIMNRKVGTIMTRKPLCVTTRTTILDATRTMNSRKISCLPVLEPDSQKLLGIITWKDIVRAFIPAAFSKADESNRLKTGVHVNPESSESARLRAKTAESARLKAVKEAHAAACASVAADGGEPPCATEKTEHAPSDRIYPVSSDDKSRISLSSEPKVDAQIKLDG